MRRIEAGCLAIIIGDEEVSNIGMEVQVVSFAPNATSTTGSRMWKVISKRPMIVFKESIQRSHKTCKGICFEANLMRIDGGDPREMVDKRINFLEGTTIKSLYDALSKDNRDISWTDLHQHPSDGGKE